MKTLLWSSRYKQSFKRKTKVRPELRQKIIHAMQLLQQDPFINALKSHKLKGKFEGSWACSVDYDLRIIFEFVNNPTTGTEEILLIDIGTHEEVY